MMGGIRDQRSNPETRFHPCRISVASGHGIGKSAAISMIIKWALDTCGDTRIVTTANTEGQLLTKTSPEIAKWARLSVTADWFKRSEEHTSELQSLMRISYAVFCLKNKIQS